MHDTDIRHTRVWNIAQEKSAGVALIYYRSLGFFYHIWYAWNRNIAIHLDLMFFTAI